MTRSANQEAVSYFEQAVAVLAHLPENPETLKWAIDLRLDLRSALWPLGRLDRVLASLREAEALAKTLRDQRTLGWLLVSLIHYFVLSGHPVEARQFGESARAIAEALRDTSLRVGTNLYLGAACLGSGDYAQAEDLLGGVTQSLEGDQSRERFGLVGYPAVLARGYLALVLADRVRFDEGIARGEEWVPMPKSRRWLC